MQHPASQASLVEPYPPSRLHYRSLRRGVRDLQAKLQGLVLWPGEPLGGVRLQGRQLPHYPGQVARGVPGYVLGVLRSHLRVALSWNLGCLP